MSSKCFNMLPAIEIKEKAKEIVRQRVEAAVESIGYERTQK